MAAAETRTVAPVVAQIASGWPSDDSGWQTMAWMRPIGASEGCGQIQGAATLVQDLGTQAAPNRHLVDVVGPSPNINLLSGANIINLAGKYVRILRQSSTGTVTISGQKYKPHWYGIIQSPLWEPDGSEAAGGKLTWSCAGASAILDQIYMFRGWERNPSSGAIVDPGFLPPFNDMIGGDMGYAYGIEPGSTYIHCRAVNESRSPWYAYYIVEYLLKGFANPSIPTLGRTGNLTWTLNDPESKLYYRPDRLDLHGKTLAEALNILAHPSRGCTWRVDISGSTATVQILDIGENATFVDLDSTSDLWKRMQARQRDDYYDLIVVTGKRPLVDITLCWDPSDASISSIEPATTWSRPTIGGSSDGKSAGLFRLKDSWLGSQYNEPGVGLRNTTPWTTTGASGARTFGGDVPPPSALILERQRPVLDGTGDRAQPRVFVGSGTSWIDLTERLEVRPSDENNGEFLLGSSVESRQYLYDLLQGTGRRLLVTIGIREWKPLLLAWRRTSDQPRDVPRILVVREEDAEQYVQLKGTVLSLSGGETGTLIVASSTSTIRTDQDVLSSTLEQLKSRYTGSGGSVEWQDAGTIDDTAGLRPGIVVRTVTDGIISMTVNAVITRRSWSYDLDGISTAYDAERVAISPRSFT